MYRLINIITLFVIGFSFIAPLGAQIEQKEIQVTQGKEALVGATVVILNSEKKIVQSGVCDSAGFFKLDLKPGLYKANIQFIGYAPATVDFEINPTKPWKTLKISLSELSTQLPTIVITASKSAQKIEETSVSLTVIKPNLIENKNPTDIQQTLQQVPGVNVTDGQANIRSGSGWSYGAGTRVLLLVDDLPLISPDANQILWPMVPFESMEQMEVIKGASSALYGSSALNGVINLRTRSDFENKTWANMYTGFHDAPARESLKWWDGLQGISGIQISHSNKIKFKEEKQYFGYLFGVNALNDQGYQYNSPDQRARLHFKLKYHNSNRLQMGLDGNISNRESGSGIIWLDGDNALIPLDSNATITSGNNFYIDPWLHFNHGNKTRHKHKINGRFFVQNNQSTDNVNVFDNAAQSYLGQYQYQMITRKNTNYNAGLYYMSAESNSELFQGFHTSKNLAAYVQVDGSFEKKLHWSLGARYEQFTLDERRIGRPVFRAGLNYKILPYSHVFASIGQGFRFPSMAEAFTSTSVGSVNIFPNENLNPELGINYEIGLKQALAIGSFKSQIEVSAYLMDYNDMIEFTFNRWDTAGGFNPQQQLGFRSVNVGAVRIWGIEATLTGMLKQGKSEWSFLLGYAYSNPKVRNPDATYIFNDITGRLLTYNSLSTDTTGLLKYRFQHQAKADIQWRYRNFRLGGSVRYNDFMRAYDVAFYDLDPFIADVEKIHKTFERGDLFIDLRLGYHLNKHVQLNVLIDNILNREYMIRPAFLGPPRRWLLQVQFHI